MKQSETLKPGSLERVVRLPLVTEMLRCRSHEKMARIQKLPLVEAVWKHRRWGIAWAIKSLRQSNVELCDREQTKL